MTPEASALLEPFEALPANEKRAFTEEIGAASDALFDLLDQEDAGTRTR